MAKNIRNINDEREHKNWSEGEMIDTFKLNRMGMQQTHVMQEWLDVKLPELNIGVSPSTAAATRSSAARPRRRQRVWTRWSNCTPHCVNRLLGKMAAARR